MTVVLVISLVALFVACLALGGLIRILAAIWRGEL